MKLRKIISGGQTGADQAGLYVARRFGFETGGTMPKGFKTLTGSRPDLAKLYGLTEHASDSYVPRTYKNVADACATIRLAGNFSSRGEICTLKAIKQLKRPHFDVDLADPPPIKEFLDWLEEKQVEVLNVAGNADETYIGAFDKSKSYLTEAMFALGLRMRISCREVRAVLGVGPEQRMMYDPNAGCFWVVNERNKDVQENLELVC